MFRRRKLSYNGLFNKFFSEDRNYREIEIREIERIKLEYKNTIQNIQDYEYEVLRLQHRNRRL